MLSGHIPPKDISLDTLRVVTDYFRSRQFTQQQHGGIRTESDRKTMQKVEKDVSKLHEEGGDCMEKLAEKADSETKLKIREDLERYKTDLAFLSQSAEIIHSSPQTKMAAPPVNTSHIAEKLRREYREKMADESHFLIPECPKLRVLIVGKEGLESQLFWARLLAYQMKRWEKN